MVVAAESSWGNWLRLPLSNTPDTSDKHHEQKRGWNMLGRSSPEPWPTVTQLCRRQRSLRSRSRRQRLPTISEDKAGLSDSVEKSEVWSIGKEGFVI